MLWFMELLNILLQNLKCITNCFKMLTVYVTFVGYYSDIIGSLAEDTNITGIMKNIPLLDKFQQHDYNITFERTEVVKYSKDYVKHYKVLTYKYNRTCPAVNSSALFTIDLGNDLQVIVQMYRFASNEYRMFPARFQFNFCEAIKKNSMGIGDIRKCGNFNGCPIVKEKHYFICNWKPNTTAFPPLIPNGQYMLEAKAMFGSIELLRLRNYGIVFRPIPGSEN